MSIMESQAEKRPHRSPSQLGMYSRCGQQYVFRYIEKQIIPPGMALIKGTCVHKVAQVNHLQKLESHEDLPVSELREIAASSFEDETAGGYVLSDEEVSRNAQTVLGEVKDRTVEAAIVYGQTVAPDYQPVLVEQRFRVNLPGTHDLLGIIDMADDRDRVVDLKTSGKRKSQDEADHSIQLTAYAAGHQVITGRPASDLRLEVIVQTKAKTTRQTVSTSRGDADYRVLANRITAMNDSVKKGAVVPAPVDSWWCSRKWCGFWHQCPFVNSERIAASESKS